MKNKNSFHSIVIILVFLFAYYGRKTLASSIGMPFESSFAKIAYVYGWWVVPVIIAIGILYGFGNIFKELRLDKGIMIGFLFSLVTVLPMLLSSIIMGEFNHEISGMKLLHKTVIAGFFEEFLFRGFLFGLLFRKAGWGFIPSSLLGALIFGIAHIYQGANPSQSIGVFLVTFSGAVWFAWLFIEWKENLWVPIFLHILMNFSWVAFDVASTALGGALPNVFRVITIALTVIATIMYNKRKDRFRIGRQQLIVNRDYVGR